MSARYVANEAALREALAEHVAVDPPGLARPVKCVCGEWGSPRGFEGWRRYEQHRAHFAAALLASGVVQPREDAVREARREHAAELAALYDNVRNAHHSDATAATPTRPGTDRPAAEDGPRNTGTGSAS